jgi:type IV secretion system protein VirB10
MADEKQAPDDINEQNVQTPTAEGVEVNTELSKVASNPKRNMAIMAIFGVIVVYIIYQIIASQQPDTPTAPPPLTAPAQVFKPNTSDNAESSAIPAVPELPKIVKPTAVEESAASNTAPIPQAVVEKPSAPSLPSMPSSIPFIDKAPTDTTAEQQKREEAKRKSSMFLISGKPETLTPEEKEIQSNFTYRGNLSQVLGRGKVIDAVLESAINSDFPGEILALVSRDVYAEDGKVILVPKGSRVIGRFSISAAGGSGRVDIAWSRIDLPSGFSVNIASDTVDHLGRQGIQGRVDNKYKEQFANVVLSSAFNIALASTLDKIVPPVPSNNTTATQSATATSISSTIGQVSANTTTYPTPTAKIGAICTQVQTNVASDPATYASVLTACQAAQLPTVDPNIALPTLITALISVSSGNTATAATASTPSQTQKASIDAFKEISSKVSDTIVKDNKFTPTVTVNQGEHIKIYVNKDYIFPIRAISKSRVMQ